MREWLPEALAVALMPVLLVQGRRTRARVPRLPAPLDAPSGLAGTSPGPPLKLVLVGESPVAGIGVDTYAEGLGAATASEIARTSGRSVAWRALGINGIRVGEASARLLPHLAAGDADVLCVAFGVNDTTAFNSYRNWQAEVASLLDQLDVHLRPRCVLLSGVPPLSAFPALPWPLRAVLGMKSASLDRGLAALAARRTRTVHVPLPATLADPGLMASDGYHPSAAGCRFWGSLLAAAVSANVWD